VSYLAFFVRRFMDGAAARSFEPDIMMGDGDGTVWSDADIIAVTGTVGAALFCVIDIFRIHLHHLFAVSLHSARLQLTLNPMSTRFKRDVKGQTRAEEHLMVDFLSLR
jgi:hypothetical protein